MGRTLIEKIIGTHAGREVRAGDIADVVIDARIARDFGGANVVKNLRSHRLAVDDAARTFFTFDCNPTGSDQGYAANQQLCRQFAREHGIRVFDINAGIGTHLAIENGLVGPGSTLVSTDSHANILGAVGAFGQGMGDVDIAHAFARGTVWFEVPRTVKVVFSGRPSPGATAKDLTLAAVRFFGASGLLGYAAEVEGEAVEALGLAGRMTLASMGTEMGAITVLLPPSEDIVRACRDFGAQFEALYPDPDAEYERTVTIDVDGLEPLIARPGRPDDVATVAEVAATPIDSVFIGSCTNGRYEDIAAAARILEGKGPAPGVVLQVVPATDSVWRRCLKEGVLDVLKEAGALIGNAGCAGCAAGQIGQTGPGQAAVSTGNRNFPGKQGLGQMYLASPETAAASAVAGQIASVETHVGRARKIFVRTPASRPPTQPATARTQTQVQEPPTRIEGRVWVMRRDNIDTDMIYHNRHLAVTDIGEMGRYTFGNLKGYEDFASKARPGDIVAAGANFGCGSSRQQAVDCFRSLGIPLIIAQSFGAIYRRNAVNSGLPVLGYDLVHEAVTDGDVIVADLSSGEVRLAGGRVVRARGLSSVEMDIYLRGGLLETGAD